MTYFLYLVTLYEKDYSAQDWHYVAHIYSGTKAACEKYIKRHMQHIVGDRIKVEITKVEL